MEDDIDKGEALTISSVGSLDDISDDEDSGFKALNSQSSLGMRPAWDERLMALLPQALEPAQGTED